MGICAENVHSDDMQANRKYGMLTRLNKGSASKSNYSHIPKSRWNVEETGANIMQKLRTEWIYREQTPEHKTRLT